jgi:pentatricopeptide repeat protein
MQTNTLAELYLRQGLVERAVEVYRAMLRVDPGNGRARRRLQELTGSPGSGVAGAAAGGRAPNAAAPTEPEPAARAGAPGMPAEPPGPGAGIHRDRIVRLERWLGRIRGSGAPGAGTGPA